MILDEIGRGTATFDGLSIAWAVVEHLHEVNRCRALFATHYHELTALAGGCPGSTMSPCRQGMERRGRLSARGRDGAADRSYGIQVARLAGLPPAVIERAREVLSRLDGDLRPAPAGLSTICRCFQRLIAQSRPAPDPLAELVDGIDPDDLTPRQALEALYRIKAARTKSGDRNG